MAKNAAPGMDESWEIESAARTVVEAEQIKADKKKWPKVKKELAKQVAAAKKALLEKQVAAKMLDAIPDD